MKIAFGDLIVSEEAKRHVKEVVDSNFISGGPKIKLLEDEWGKLFDYKHSMAMSNGTDADMAACMTLYDKGAKRGDEIIAPALAFASVGNSILAAGFKPVFVDIERKTLNINPDKIEEKINDKTKAIMAVHTMGKPCDMDKITNLAKKHKLRVLEDCCEAHGAKYNDKFIGTFGDAAAFSYYVAHIVSCGDGGMISTNNSEVYESLRSIKYHGREPGSLYFDHIKFGFNFRMNDLTASIGLPEIKNFNEIFDKRKENLYYLLEKTKDLEDLAYFNLEEDHETISPHAFSLTLKDPKHNYKGLYDHLEKNEIQCKRNFGSMPTQHNAFAFMGHKLGEFPEAEYVGNNGLHFGIHQFLEREHLDYTSEVLHKYFDSI
jgi:dTDP-4-amino-4,6-dideoxygalactose transaminase